MVVSDSMSKKVSNNIKKALERVHEAVEEVHDEIGPPEGKMRDDINDQVNFARALGDKISELFEDDEFVKAFRERSRLIWELAESRIMLVDKERGDEE